MHKLTDDEAARYQRLLKQDGFDPSLDEAREAARRVFTLLEVVIEELQDPEKRKRMRRALLESDINIWSSQDGQLAILLLKRGPARGRRF